MYYKGSKSSNFWFFSQYGYGVWMTIMINWIYIFIGMTYSKLFEFVQFIIDMQLLGLHTTNRPKAKQIKLIVRQHLSWKDAERMSRISVFFFGMLILLSKPYHCLLTFIAVSYRTSIPVEQTGPNTTSTSSLRSISMVPNVPFLAEQ